MKFNNEKGYTLFSVLLVVLLLTIIGGAYLIVMTSEARQSVWHSDRTQAYYLARSGAEAGFKWVLNNQREYVKGDGDPEVFLKGDFEQGLRLETSANPQEPINVVIEYDASFGSLSEGSFRIISTGQYRKTEQRVILNLESRTDDDLNLLFDKALFSVEDISGGFSVHASIIGDVETNNKFLAGYNVTGDIVEDSTRIYNSADFKKVEEDLEGKDGNDLIISGGGPNTPPYVISEEAHYSNLTVESWNILEIHTGGDNLRFLIDTFRVAGNARVDVVGGGTVYLFIRESGTIETPNTGVGDLIIILDDGVHLDIKTPGGSKFSGYVYGPNASVTLDGIVEVEGALIVNEIFGETGSIEYKEFDFDIEFLKDYLSVIIDYWVQNFRWE